MKTYKNIIKYDFVRPLQLSNGFTMMVVFLSISNHGILIESIFLKSQRRISITILGKIIAVNIFVIIVHYYKNPNRTHISCNLNARMRLKL